MKRSGPPQRRKSLARGSGPQRRIELQRGQTRRRHPDVEPDRDLDLGQLMAELLETCCGKRRYATREAAVKEIGRLQALDLPKAPVAAYLCQGDWWHMTSQRPDERIARGTARAHAMERKAHPAGEFTPAVKLAARTRAGDGDPDEACCESCGYWLGPHGGVMQHRDARGMGGSRNPVIRSVVNAALQCWTCNGRAERRNPQMNEAGFYLKPGQHPAMTPIVRWFVKGGTRKLWLTPDGGYSDQAPEEAEAA